MEIIFYHVLESYADFFYSRKCFSQLILLLIFEWFSPRLIFSLRRENSDSILLYFISVVNNQCIDKLKRR